jgi:4-hydroxy-tetrahydrodipicolinate reductase
MAEIAIGVTGCGGRMGRMLVATIHGTEGCRVAGGIEAPGNPLLGRDLGELAGVGRLGLEAGADPARLFAMSDVVVDFTTPAAAVAHANEAARQKKPIVIGTTGLERAQEDAVAAAAKTAPILRAANMSLGVNLLLGVVREVASRLGPDYDIEIVEMHHRHKVDAPSGTALALGRAAAAGRNIDLDHNSARGRDGITGERKRGEIGFASLRGGDVVGDHTVIFAADSERIELTHRAGSRLVFARGAVRAACWLASPGRAPGLYGMNDVLGLR